MGKFQMSKYMPQGKCQTKKLESKRASFTLVEVLVAMAILMMLIGAMVGIEVTNIRLADSGKKQLQATGLARGALNLVRTIRDTNILNGRAAFTGPEASPPYSLDSASATKKYLKKTGNTWSLTTVTSPAPTYYQKTLDGTTYTVEVTVE